MVDTQTVGKTPIIKRSMELYLTVCQLAATMQVQINYHEMSDIRTTFKDFRHCLYEMYYLLIDSYEFDPKLKTDFEKWSAISKISRKHETEFYIESLNLFKFMKEELNRIELFSGDVI